MNTPKSTIKAKWYVELFCKCPKCGDHVDVLSVPDFWDGRQLAITEHNTDNSDNLEVSCPSCGHEFTVCCEY